MCVYECVCVCVCVCVCAIMKTMCPPGYHHNGFWQLMYLGTCVQIIADAIGFRCQIRILSFLSVLYTPIGEINTK